MNPERKVIIIAGPNGAGKTTFAREFLPNEAACPVFVNADLIAAGLAPFVPETAAAQPCPGSRGHLAGQDRRRLRARHGSLDPLFARARGYGWPHCAQ